MKTILSRRQDAYEMVVPVRGGFRVRFESGRATMPSDVAEVLLAATAGFYSLAEVQAGEISPGQRILVIRDVGLGDVLMATPLIRHLAGRGGLVDVQTYQRFICLFDDNPHVQQVLSLEAGTPDHGEYAAVLDLRMFVENAENQQHYEHRVPGFARIADIDLPEEAWSIDYFARPAEQDAIQQKIDAHIPATPLPLIAYVWGANSDTRTWSEAQHDRVLSALLAANFRVVVLSAVPEPLPLTHPNLCDATGKLSLRETAAALSVSDVVVTPDTGLFHLASALGKPIVTYFGAWPITERATHTMLSVLNAPQNCARMPCRSYQCFNREADGQPRCLSVPAEIVVGAVRHHLGEAGTAGHHLAAGATETITGVEKRSQIALCEAVDGKTMTAALIPGRAAVFCTAAIDTDPARYQAWADYYSAFFAGDDVDLFLFNDGPAEYNVTGNVTVVPVGETALGRIEAGGCFPGWKRSMGEALRRLGTEYAAIAHVESDMGITPGGKAAFLKALRTPGFFTGWCPRHRFPETALQVINSEAARDWYTRRYADRNDMWHETFDGECFEHLVQRELSPVYILTGNRHEGDPPAFDPSWDYLGQCKLDEFTRLYSAQAENSNHAGPHGES